MVTCDHLQNLGMRCVGIDVRLKAKLLDRIEPKTKPLLDYGLPPSILMIMNTQSRINEIVAGLPSS